MSVGWWVPANPDPFATDQNGKRVVQAESDHRGPATGGEADDLGSIGAPSEVSGPDLSSRVEQADSPTC